MNKAKLLILLTIPFLGAPDCGHSVKMKVEGQAVATTTMAIVDTTSRPFCGGSIFVAGPETRTVRIGNFNYKTAPGKDGKYTYLKFHHIFARQIGIVLAPGESISLVRDWPVVAQNPAGIPEIGLVTSTTQVRTNRATMSWDGALRYGLLTCNRGQTRVHVNECLPLSPGFAWYLKDCANGR